MAPQGLELVSVRKAASQGLELLSNATHSRRFLSVLTTIQEQLRAMRIPVLLDDRRGAPSLARVDSLSRSQRRWLGQVALELYFAQLLHSQATILDLWPSRFGIDASGDARWNPRPFYVHWDRPFREGLCNVYKGFFFDKPERFERGVHQLGVETSAVALLQHLGDGNQRNVRFQRSKLESTLHEMATARGPGNGSLHRNFVALGLYMMGLYALLEPLDLAFDVRSAFMRSCAER
ncbi:MAG: hypothetical protein PVI24_18370 [Myxococcales bacterium]